MQGGRMKNGRGYGTEKFVSVQSNKKEKPAAIKQQGRCPGDDIPGVFQQNNFVTEAWKRPNGAAAK